MKYPQEVQALVLTSSYYCPTPRADVVILSPPAIPLIGDLLSHTLSPLLSRLMLPRSFRSRNDRKGLGTTDNGTIFAFRRYSAARSAWVSPDGGACRT
jgi:hypothetical protein